MMDVPYISYVQTLLLTYMIFGNFTIQKVMSSKTNRVVFQWSLLHDGETVSCYGRCDKDLKSGALKFNVPICEGRKVRFGCETGNVIKIRVATLGKLSPDRDICNYQKDLDCLKDITSKVESICSAGRQCVVDLSTEQLRNNCGKLKNTNEAMDIRYLCEKVSSTDLPMTIVSSKKIPTIKTTAMTKAISATRTKPTTSKRVVKTTSLSTRKHKITSIRKATETTKRTSYTTKKNLTHVNKTMVIPSSTKDTDMFWSMTAYTAITNSEFMKKNKTHLALALLLSMFVGMVLCLCFFLDYCRRAKKKRTKQLIESKVTLVQDFQGIHSNEHIELTKPKMVEVIALNGSLPRHKVMSCGDVGYINNNNNDDEEGDVYAVSSPFFKRSLEHKSLIHHTHIHTNQERVFSPSTLPPPPNNFLVESSSSSSNDLLPPPNDYDGDNNITCSTVRVSTPTGSCNANTLLSPQKTVSHDQCDSEMVEVEEVYLEDQVLNDNLESLPYEYVEVAPYHASDEYSSSPQVPRSMTYHRTDNYVIPPKAKFASMNRRVICNDETSQEDTVRTLDSKSRMRNKCNPKDRPGLQKSKSLDEPKKKTYFTNNNGHHYLVRNPRRGRIHVMQKCEETLPRRNYNSQKATTYSDNEASRRRRRCEMEYRRNCSCQQGSSLNELYCMKCGQLEESHLKCCSSLTSNCQSSHDEACGDNHGPLLSISNELIKNKQYRVEESGYQSHDTGTDSLCSSTFSTDQEDGRMFLPSSANNGLHNGCRSKSCRVRVQGSNRDPRFIIVRGNNKSKLSRRFRHGDYTNNDVHPNNNCTSVDVHQYDSSMDDASSRDSVKLFRRIRKHNMGDDIGLIEDINCNCIHGKKPSGTIGRNDGIETS